MGTFRVPATLTWTGAGSPGVNVWHVRTASISDPGQNLDLDNAIEALGDFYDACASFMGHSARASIGSGIVDISDPLAPRAVERPIRLGTQAVSGGISQVLQFCISWRTALATRKGMGRTFVGPLASSVDNEATGLPSDTNTAQIRAAVTALSDTSGLDNGWALGIVSGAGTNLQVYRDIIGGSVKQKFAVLRSRRD